MRRLNPVTPCFSNLVTPHAVYQELRMTIADSDSGITEDLENTYFNPTLYSTNCEDDTISTKSALVWAGYLATVT